jgi:hypothetical protein
MLAERGRGVVATWKWVGVRKHHASAALRPGKDLISIVQEAGWALGTAWTGMEYVATT